MDPAFPGFPAQAITFLRGLKKNNKREWFQARKDVFEEHVKAPMVRLVDALNAELVRFAPDYVTDPKDAMYRIYRDTRFSSDKTPYKTHMAASLFRRGMTKHGGAGFYFEVGVDGVAVAGGVYIPPKETLLAIRRHMAENHEEFRQLIGEECVVRLLGELHGEKLSRAPKGYPADHPAADLIRGKQWYFDVTLDSGLAITAQLLPEIAARFQAMAATIEFLNRPLIRRRNPRFV